MARAKTITLKELKALARKHLGAGGSKLKGKDELLRAVRRWLPKALKSAAQRLAKPAAKKVKAKSKAKEGEKAPKPPPKRALKASRGTNRPSVAAPLGVTKSDATPGPGPEPVLVSEPIVEGFFVARVVSEGEARRRHLTQTLPDRAPPPADDIYDEHLGELPAAYEDDATVLLPKDPYTLFVFWDFNPRTRKAATEGLRDPRAVLRVFAGAELVRELDIALESKSFYVHGLQPGRAYRVEAHFVGHDGKARRIGGSAAIGLPSVGPSKDLTVRFLRLPWGLRLSRLREHLAAGRARLGSGGGEKHLELWRRVPLPGSQGFAEDHAADSRGGSSQAFQRP